MGAHELQVVATLIGRVPFYVPPIPIGGDGFREHDPAEVATRFYDAQKRRRPGLLEACFAARMKPADIGSVLIDCYLSDERRAVGLAFDRRAKETSER